MVFRSRAAFYGKREQQWSIRLEEFSGGEVADEAAVGGEEVVLGQVFESNPSQLADQKPCRDESKRRPSRARIGAWLRVFHATSLNAKERRDSRKSKKGACGMKSYQTLL